MCLWKVPCKYHIKDIFIQLSRQPCEVGRAGCESPDFYGRRVTGTIWLDVLYADK